MRVISGKCRSIQLKTPKGMSTRPTQDRIKETLFNIIQNEVPGGIFVDLFAGSGQMGIEALSRGAARAYFVDNSKEALECIRDNLNFTRLISQGIILNCNFKETLFKINENAADIVFIDPPYNGGYEDQIFDMLSKAAWVNENTLIILEASLDNNFAHSSFELVRVKEYKTNKHIFYRKIN